MLDRAHRVRSGRELTGVIRRGRRAGATTLVGHLARALNDAEHDAEPVPRVGLVVGRAVGGAVVRNQVKRRLRHVIGARLATLPADTLLVVRALPPAATASSAELGSDLDRVLDRLLGRLTGQMASQGR